MLLLSIILRLFHHYFDSKFFHILILTHIFSNNMNKALIIRFSLKQVIQKLFTCQDVPGKNVSFNENTVIKPAVLLKGIHFHRYFPTSESHFLEHFTEHLSKAEAFLQNG